MRLLLFTFLLSALSFGQDRNGISYQALIINPNVEQLPGQDNDHSPLTNTDICLQFHIINSSGNYEYSESQSVTTDAYGMVNLVIGTGTPIGAITWDAVAWSAEAKSLKVDLDITGACTSFTELSNQQLTSVPFALYSPASNVPGPKGDPGDPGADGDSAYQVWLDAGNTGTEQEFLDSLEGADGNEGLLPSGDAIGNTTYWDGSEWITTSNNLYNDGSNVMIGTTTAEPSSAFTVASTSQGVLLPKMTLSQRDAISNPTSGLLIFQTDNTPGFYYFDGTSWKGLIQTAPVSSGGSSDSNTLIYTTNGF